MPTPKQAQLIKQEKMPLSILASLFSYDEITGYFIKIRNGGRADWPDERGYRRISFYYEGKRFCFRAHRMAVLFMTGKWPEEEVDHIDCNKDNNAWPNLRVASRSQNILNVKIRKTNTSGFKGAHFNKEFGKWTAKCTYDGLQYYLGSFDTAEEAHNAYCEKAKELHEKFHRPK